MSESQDTMMKKIEIMKRWLDIHRSDDDRIPMTSKERREFVNKLSFVGTALGDAEAILHFMQRGQVFDMPSFLGHQSCRQYF